MLLGIWQHLRTGPGLGRRYLLRKRFFLIGSPSSGQLASLFATENTAHVRSLLAGF
jgi:hypothetical protein